MDPQLHKAAVQGSVATLRKLICERPDILLSRTPWDNTALHIAGELGHAPFAQEILDQNDRLLLSKNADGDTPLHLAAKAGKLEVVGLLIERATRIQMDLSPTSFSDTENALLMANRAGDTPLHEAVKHGMSAVALKLLAAEPSCGHKLNVKTKISPFHIAAREGLIVVVSRIVAQPWVGERLSPSDAVKGTALHQAVLGGHIRVVEILLHAVAEEEVGRTDSSENNALHYAMQKNKKQMVKLLLNQKAELAYKRNRDLLPPLHMAVYYGSTEAMSELLKHCPDVVEMVDSAGRNALHIAIVSGKMDVLRCLLKYVHPEDVVNRVDRQGNTPLHLAAKLNRSHLGLLLLKNRRVNPCLLNRDCRTARSLIEFETQIPVDTTTIYFWKALKKQESTKCKAHQLPPGKTPDWLDDFNKYVQLRMGTYTLVATLTATVTFSSTFTMPGGYDQQYGTAVLVHRTAFKVFIVANTLAMLSSIVVVFGFIWTKRQPQDFRTGQVVWSHRLTVVACVSMVVSLMTAVYLTIEPKSPWLAYLVIAMGCCTPVVMYLMLGRDLLSTRV